MRWADVYVPHVSPASMSPASMRRCPRSAPAPSAPAREAMGRRLRCWPPVLPSGIVALRGRLLKPEAIYHARCEQPLTLTGYSSSTEELHFRCYSCGESIVLP